MDGFAIDMIVYSVLYVALLLCIGAKVVQMSMRRKHSLGLQKKDDDLFLSRNATYIHIGGATRTRKTCRYIVCKFLHYIHLFIRALTVCNAIYITLAVICYISYAEFTMDWNYTASERCVSALGGSPADWHAVGDSEGGGTNAQVFISDSGLVCKAYHPRWRENLVTASARPDDSQASVSYIERRSGARLEMTWVRSVMYWFVNRVSFDLSAFITSRYGTVEGPIPALILTRRDLQVIGTTRILFDLDDQPIAHLDEFFGGGKNTISVAELTESSNAVAGPIIMTDKFESTKLREQLRVRLAKLKVVCSDMAPTNIVFDRDGELWMIDTDSCLPKTLYKVVHKFGNLQKIVLN